MLNTLRLGTLIAVAILTAGCLQKDTTHTLYLSPDGSVIWTVNEANVHSDEGDPGKRIAEEQGYLGPALIGAHTSAQGLAGLTPHAPVRTTVLRDERPFHVVTEGRFAAVDKVLQRVFTEAGLQTSAVRTSIHDTTTLRVRFDFSRELEGRDTPMAKLIEDFDHVEFVLVEGRFGPVDGFDVTDDTKATLSKEWLERVEKAYDAKGTIEFSLSWSRR